MEVNGGDKNDFPKIEQDPSSAIKLLGITRKSRAERDKRQARESNSNR